MFIKVRHSFMQRAGMMGRKDYGYSKWFVSVLVCMKHMVL
jgi:hypothetical protein